MIKQEIISQLSSFDEKEPAVHKKLLKTKADLSEIVMAMRLGHKYVDVEHYDAVSPTGKKLEYKSCAAAKDAITISNLNNKEDVILYIFPGVSDDKEHWFYFPRWEIHNVVGINPYEWMIAEDAECYDSKFVYPNLTRGKCMTPKHYMIDINYTWRKGYMRAREFSMTQIKELSVWSDEAVKTYLSFAHSDIEKELLDIE